MINKGSLKSLILVWVPLFMVYFSSELVLRVFYVKSGNIDKLPAILQDSLKAQQAEDKTREELDEAINTKGKKEIIKAYYSHSYQLNEDDRNELYKELLSKYPEDYECGEAFIAVMSEESNKYNYEAFIKFIEKFDRNKQKLLLQKSWYKINGFSNEIIKKFMKRVIKEQYISGEFFTIYKDLESKAYNLGEPYETEKVLEKLKMRCIRQYKKLLEKLKKEQQSEEGGNPPL